MTTRKVYQSVSHSRGEGLPDIEMSWTRTAKSAATHKREKEELSVRIAWDWRKRYAKTLSYSEVQDLLENWDDDSVIHQFSQHTQDLVKASLDDFVNDVDAAYTDKEEKIEANKQKRRDRKAADKKQAKVKGKEAVKSARKSMKR